MNYKLVAGIFLVSVLLFGCVQPPQTQNVTANASVMPRDEGKINAALGEDWEAKYPDLAARIKGMQQGYSSKRDETLLPAIVFSELPPFPKDFDEIALLVYIGSITEMNRIGPEYFKQPEFYAGWGDQGVPLYQHPPKDRWGAFGYGTYPSEMLVNSPRNAEWNVSFFMHTSWLVQTYQGIGFNVVFPATAALIQNNFPDGQKNITQDPAKVKDYFEVSVEPSSLLLEPAFPIFKQGWTQRVVVKAKAKNVPPGRYAIGLDIGGPDSKLAEEWLWKYKTQYSGNAGMTGVGRPWYTVFIDVT